jgi:hypothetical protein
MPIAPICGTNYYNSISYKSKVLRDDSKNNTDEKTDTQKEQIFNSALSACQKELLIKETYDLSQPLSEKVREKERAPYSNLATDGIITYKGITFVCNEKNNQICLGDVSDPRNCLSIPLSKGGSLIVNRDNLDGLSKAIDMFSPEDINRIMRAIAQDTKVQQVQNEIDEEKSSIIKDETIQ